MGIVSLLKLKKKSNYKEWRNAIKEFCKVNRYWEYMVGKIPKSTASSKADAKLKEAYEIKLMK